MTSDEIYFDPSWLQRGWLASLIAANRLGVGAELGVFRGGLTFLILDHFPDLVLHAVDIFENLKETPSYRTDYYDFDRTYPEFLRKAEGYGDRLVIHKGYTHDVACEIEDGSLDFVFIDADHNYEGVRQDIIDWRPKLRPGGFLCGHDIHMPGVAKAVAEQCPDSKISRACLCWVEQQPGGADMANRKSPFSDFIKISDGEDRHLINPDLVMKVTCSGGVMKMFLLSGEIVELREEDLPVE